MPWCEFQTNVGTDRVRRRVPTIPKDGDTVELDGASFSVLSVALIPSDYRVKYGASALVFCEAVAPVPTAAYHRPEYAMGWDGRGPLDYGYVVSCSRLRRAAGHRVNTKRGG